MPKIRIKIFLIGIAIIALSIFVYFTFSSKNNDSEDGFDAVFSGHEKAWQKGEINSLTISLKEGVGKDSFLHAVAFTISFDPETLEPISVHEGTIWSKTNKLEEKIDHSLGLIKVSYGMAFDGEIVEGAKTLASFEFKVIGDKNEVEIIPLAKSAARMGERDYLWINLKPAILKIKQ